MISVASSGEHTGHGNADTDKEFALPFIELAMAFEVAEDGEKTWAECLQEAAFTSQGELLFILPTAGNANNEGERAVLRMGSGETARLAFAYRVGVETVFLDESEADDTVASFAHACVDLFERLRADGCVPVSH